MEHFLYPGRVGDHGHVFVVHGDLRQVACDAWLLPCGHQARASRHWLEPFAGRELPPMPVPPPEWRAERSRVMKVSGWPADLPEPWLVHVGGGQNAPVSWFMAGVSEFLARVADDLGALPRNGRAKHLVAVPVVGTGQGGARRTAGDVVRELLPLLVREAASRDIDLALVTNEERTFAAAQAQRGADPSAWNGLPDARLRVEGDRIADLAARGELVLFVGAGASMGAGLPSWDGLLDRLAREAGMSDAERAALRKHSPLDQARIVELRLSRDAAPSDSDRDRPLGRAVAAELTARHGYGLTHALLAALPVVEIVTTNYDELFERASRAIGRTISVLPHAPGAGHGRWILKMHGCVREPDHIVLTREDYLRYDQRRQALAAIVQALLITRHMLFIGFSLKDDNFHRIADAVRRARFPSRDVGKPMTVMDHFGSAIDLFSDPMAQGLWSSDLDWISIDPHPPPDGDDDTARRRRSAAARHLDVFLDYVVARTGTTTAHLLDLRYEGALSEEERALGHMLKNLMREVDREPSVKRAAAWKQIEALLSRLGAGSRRGPGGA